jgi:hypothetical protein
MRHGSVAHDARLSNGGIAWPARLLLAHSGDDGRPPWGPLIGVVPTWGRIFDGLLPPHVEFHSQLLNDYVTIDEYGRTLLEELDR